MNNYKAFINDLKKIEKALFCLSVDKALDMTTFYNMSELERLELQRTLNTISHYTEIINTNFLNVREIELIRR